MRKVDLWPTIVIMVRRRPKESPSLNGVRARKQLNVRQHGDRSDCDSGFIDIESEVCSHLETLRC